MRIQKKLLTLYQQPVDNFFLTMLTFPCCKINLGLNVTERRPDGYHNLETVFYPIPLNDALEIVLLTEPSEVPYRLSQYGTVIEGPVEKNLVVRAYLMLATDFQLPPVDIYLYKHIPSGAGLGGGSADAAYMLCLLNDFFHLHLSEETLISYASRLGADCAFFVHRRPTFATGIGDIFTPIGLDLKEWQIVIIKPDIFVSTAEAFRGITPQHPKRSLLDIVKEPVDNWRYGMVNDFEESIFPHHPRIAEIKQQLYDMGAVYAAMSGSGSSVFGLFQKESPVPKKQDFPEDFYFSCTL